MQFGSILATAVVAGMASPVLAVALPQDVVPVQPPPLTVFGCFVRMSIVTTKKDEKSISTGDFRPTTNPGQLEFDDNGQKITVKVDKNCQSAGVSKHRKEVQFNALQKLSKDGGPFQDPDQPLIELQ
ncbi:hypothetical protein PspLS_11817 [Pyricularia sp. CBS 133598]|nr:hypothetical protein PspLS_11817 [Pyricularia sp. CBS 133598]